MTMHSLKEPKPAVKAGLCGEGHHLISQEVRPHCVNRLYPTIARLERVTNETVDINGITIPKDMLVMVPVYALHRDPEFWPEPEEFKPDRWGTQKLFHCAALKRFQSRSQGDALGLLSFSAACSATDSARSISRTSNRTPTCRSEPARGTVWGCDLRWCW